MKNAILLLALGLCACGPEAGEGERKIAPAAAGNVLQDLAPATRANAVVPRPTDQAQLDRMILAGYTPHSEHLHAPGVNECPLTKGSEAVM
ncbi:MAG: hypothetical protein ABIS39_04470 [Sphingomicrobium sp.]